MLRRAFLRMTYWSHLSGPLKNCLRPYNAVLQVHVLATTVDPPNLGESPRMHPLLVYSIALNNCKPAFFRILRVYLSCVNAGLAVLI